MAVNMVQIKYITELHKVIMKLYFSKYTTYKIFNYRYVCQMQDGRAGIAYVLLHTVVIFFIIELCQKKSATWILCILFYPIFPMLQKICYMDSMYLLPFYAIQICYMDFMYLIPSYLFYATSHYISLILSVLSHYMNM